MDKKINHINKLFICDFNNYIKYIWNEYFKFHNDDYNIEYKNILKIFCKDVYDISFSHNKLNEIYNNIYKDYESSKKTILVLENKIKELEKKNIQYNNIIEDNKCNQCNIKLNENYIDNYCIKCIIKTK